MKCHICGFEIPEGKKYCPGCGRVVRNNLQNAQQVNTVSSDTMKFDRPVTGQDKSAVYRPAASKPSAPTQKTIHIPDIFSTDPNAPEYTDPHAYDTATAHVLEYDRMFVSRSDKGETGQQQSSAKYTDDSTKQFAPVSANKSKRIIIEQEPDGDYYDDGNYDENEYDNDYDTSEADRKAGPHINIKAIIIIVAIILGIAVCVTGVYQIGKQFGFWADNGTSNISDEDGTDKEKLPANKEDSSKDEDNDDESQTTYKTGIYTVKSDQKNIFVYKSATDQRITATIPNGAIIEITEIKDDLGKTTYNSYTGWVEMTDVEYTPDEEPEEKPDETTTKAEEESQKNDEETPDLPTEPGTYTVTLSGNTPLNVRDSNSTSGEIIGSLSNGTEVEVLEVKSSWGRISLDGTEGWVYMEYLK